MSASVQSSPPAHPSRRAVTRAAAWSVPVVAVAATAPAFAASCTPLTGVAMPIPATGSISNGGLDYSLTYQPPAGAFSAPVTMTIKAGYTGRMAAGSEAVNGPDLYDTYNPVGAQGTRGLALIQTVTGNNTPPQRDARGVYTFGFTKPVSNLRFTLTDIDVLAGDYDDRIELSGAYAEVPAGRGAGISGTGSQATPWRGAGSYNDNSSSAGNVRLLFAGPVSTFELTYWNAITSFSGVDRNQGVFLTGISFDYQPC